MRQFLLLSNFILIFTISYSQNSVVGIYPTLIPTSYNTYDEGCNGPSAELKITLPPGESFTVTGINIYYTMSAVGDGYMVDQRSKVKCVNTGITEPEYFGVGAFAGTYTYNRPGVGIANGTYAGGTELVFQFYGRRTFEGVPGCNSSTNYANNFSITILYGNENTTKKVGVNTTTPANSFDVAGKVRVGDDYSAPQAGTIRFNSTNKDFEGYNGEEWLSLTKSNHGNEYGISKLSTTHSLPDEAENYYGFKLASNDTALVTISQTHLYLYKWDGTSFIKSVIALPEMITFFNTFKISFSGSDILIADSFKNDGRGRVYAFNYNGTLITYLGQINASDGNVNAYFGHDIVQQDDFAYISAPYQSTSLPNTGKVYVYKKIGATWTYQYDIIAPDIATDDRFGSSLDISGTHLIISSPFKTVSGLTTAGAVYLFKKVNNVWFYLNTYYSPNIINENLFGLDLAIDMNYIAVGSALHNVALFKRDNNIWTYNATISQASNTSDLIEFIQFHNNILYVTKLGLAYNDSEIMIFKLINNEYKYYNSINIGIFYNIIVPSMVVSNQFLFTNVNLDGSYCSINYCKIPD